MNHDTSRKAPPMAEVNDVVAELRRLAGKATTGKWYIYTGEDGEPISLAAHGVGPNGGWVGKKVAQFGVPYRSRTAEQIRSDADYLEAVQPAAIVRLLDLIAHQAARLEEKDALIERLKLEAQIHAGEARCHKSTVHEAYQACTGATGEPGNWHGAEPIKIALAEAKAALTAAEAEKEGYRAALQAADATLTGRDAFALDPIVGSDNPHEHAAGLVRAALSPKKEQTDV